MVLRLLVAVLILTAAGAATAGYWHLLGGRGGGGSRTITSTPDPGTISCTFGSATFPCDF